MCHSRDLSVRECERRVRAGGARPRKKTTRKKTTSGSIEPGLRALMENAERVYGSPVTIARDTEGSKGTISLRFFDDSDLVRVLKIMGVDTDIS